MNKSDHKNRKQNRLINEKSPYLLQHAYNPIDWYPWSEDAFEKAKREDKPVFLSIGYSTCHWCHVMGRESFENQEVADLLNRDYVSIKVDREERPDIDTIYMDVCQALTGRGGWPLTIIMTPEKEPFYAATYLPKIGRFGLLGMDELLPRIAEVWKNDRKSILESSKNISESMNKSSQSVSTEKLTEDIFHDAYKQFARAFDSSYGGFSSAPKFPIPHNLYFLMRYFMMTGEQNAIKMTEKTLDSMYRGGIYDHIGFGFARYSTDNKWLVPHFEKMLYDNALLAIAYLEACQLTKNEQYARISKEIFAYILRDMTSPEGGFYSAQDADSEGEEGKFYVWSLDEILSVLREEGREFCTVYNISEKGNFEGKNIPNLIDSSVSEADITKLEASRRQLFEYREKRVHPFKDDKILTSWNGLMIAALAIGSRVLNDENYLKAAKKAADFIFTKLRRSDGRLLARYRDGEALYNAYAVDYSYLIWGLIELYESSYESKYLEFAMELNSDLVKYFWDKENGGLFLYGEDSEQLLIRPKESYDGAFPSANSVAAMNFLRLTRLTGNSTLEAKAEGQLRIFSTAISKIPTAHSFFLSSAIFALGSSREIVIAGKKEDKNTQLMLKTVNEYYLPDTVTVFKMEGNDEIQKIAPYLEGMKMVNGQAAAYICHNYSCQQPITSVDEFINAFVSS